MYIFKPNSSGGLDEKLSKPSTSSLVPVADASLARPLLAPVVPTQTAILAGASAPSGLTLTSIVDAVITAGVASNLAVPLTSEFATTASNESSVNSLAGALEAFSKNALTNLDQANFVPVPISSLSEADSAPAISIAATLSDFVPAAAMSAMPANILPAPTNVVDVSVAVPIVNAPVVITALTDNELNVTNSANGNVHAADVVSQAAIQSYINHGVGTFTVATNATHLSSLSLTGNVSFTAQADEVTSGITVSAIKDSSDVSLFLIGGAKAAQGSSDVISLGDGNNLILDAGDGQVVFSLGSGTNVIMLTGTGVSGSVQFANHTDHVGDFVTIAANGVSSAQDLASQPLVTISGLNNREHSLDTITFLGDMGSNLSWAGATHAAQDAQVIKVSADVGSLVSWVSAAQNLAANAHSVAWFQFGGNTYVLETATGAAGNHVGDTLVRLTGLTQFTGSDGELAFGSLHLAG